MAMESSRHLAELRLPRSKPVDSENYVLVDAISGIKTEQSTKDAGSPISGTARPAALLGKSGVMVRYRATIA